MTGFYHPEIERAGSLSAPALRILLKPLRYTA